LLTSNEFEPFFSERSVKHFKIGIGAYGQVERINRRIRAMFAKLTEPENDTHWDTVTEKIEYTPNSTLHKSIKEIPSKFQFGVQEMGEIVVELKERLQDIQDTIVTERLKKIR